MVARSQKLTRERQNFSRYIFVSHTHVGIQVVVKQIPVISVKASIRSGMVQLGSGQGAIYDRHYSQNSAHTVPNQTNQAAESVRELLRGSIFHCF